MRRPALVAAVTALALLVAAADARPAGPRIAHLQQFRVRAVISGEWSWSCCTPSASGEETIRFDTGWQKLWYVVPSVRIFAGGLWEWGGTPNASGPTTQKQVAARLVISGKRTASAAGKCGVFKSVAGLQIDDQHAGFTGVDVLAVPHPPDSFTKMVNGGCPFVYQAGVPSAFATGGIQTFVNPTEDPEPVDRALSPAAFHKLLLSKTPRFTLRGIVARPVHNGDYSGRGHLDLTVTFVRLHGGY